MAEISSKYMTLFDTRLYRNLSGIKDDMQPIYPMFDYQSYVSDWNESVGSIQTAIAEAEASLPAGDEKDAQIKALKAKMESIKEFNKTYSSDYLAPQSLVHPYAIVKIAGASGTLETLAGSYLYDSFNKRRFYEIDGESGYSGHYAKTPTTTALIKWGNESEKNKTPYSFQDFVFCKWWNKIENNRLITLRRYASPVTDNIEFSDYVTSDTANGKTETTEKDAKGNEKTKKAAGNHATTPWTPLATAVTYFGKDTGNDLSKILSFSASYNWEEMKGAKDNHPIDVTSSQNDAGANLVSDTFSGVSSGLGVIAKFMGILGDVSNGQTLNMDNATGVPPDPYKDGPYENRILGPLNVITNTYRRNRGLTFKHDGLKLNFEYIARPISGINNKAILMDLLANILVLGYSSGSWFGGMHRYRCDKPAMYPWKYGDAMNKMHRGQLFGQDGAVNSLTRSVYGDGKSLLSTFLPDAAKMISGMFSAAVNKVKSMFGGGDDETKKAQAEQAATDFENSLETGSAKTLQKLIAAKATKGTTIPYLQNNRALLTGEPVGDWHLTIGNPFNPIAMIGNLIVKDLNIEFYDELGPDDFPIGFKATITLAHGLGRDRDAIESMFNRGFGRIYTLSSEFRSSADGETKVDDYTGTDGKPRKGYEEIRQTYYGGGTRGIMNIKHTELKNKGAIYNGSTLKMKSLHPSSGEMSGKFTMSYYQVNPWQMGMNM